MYTYVSWFVFLSLCLSLNVRNGVRLYYDSLYVRIRLCIVVVCLFRTEYLYECWAILSLIVRVYVCLLMPVSLWISVVVFLNASISVRLCCHWLYMYWYLSWSAFLSLFLCLSQYPEILLSCIRTSLDSYFFVSLSLWMRVAVSDYIMTDWRCKCTHLDSCFWLFFSECFYPCSALLTLIKWSAFVSFSMSMSVSEYIIHNLHVCEQTRSARNSAMEDWFLIV